MKQMSRSLTTHLATLSWLTSTNFMQLIECFRNCVLWFSILIGQIKYTGKSFTFGSIQCTWDHELIWFLRVSSVSHSSYFRITFWASSCWRESWSLGLQLQQVLRLISRRQRRLSYRLSITLLKTSCSLRLSASSISFSLSISLWCGSSSDKRSASSPKLMQLWLQNFFYSLWPVFSSIKYSSIVCLSKAIYIHRMTLHHLSIWLWISFTCRI